MSRSRILPALSSSRQMMIAWKVSGDFAEAGDHGLAAGLDALGDGDLALAREQLDRAHLAEIHADRIVGAVGRLRARAWRRPRSVPASVELALGLGLLFGASSASSTSSVSMTLMPMS